MKREYLTGTAVLLALLLGGHALAADPDPAGNSDLVADCEVVAKEGNKVVLNCGKDARILEVGSPVKVVPQVKRRHIEGC